MCTKDAQGKGMTKNPNRQAIRIFLFEKRNFTLLPGKVCWPDENASAIDMLHAILACLNDADPLWQGGQGDTDACSVLVVWQCYEQSPVYGIYTYRFVMPQTLEHDSPVFQALTGRSRCLDAGSSAFGAIFHLYFIEAYRQRLIAITRYEVVALEAYDE